METIKVEMKEEFFRSLGLSIVHEKEWYEDKIVRCYKNIADYPGEKFFVDSLCEWAYELELVKKNYSEFLNIYSRSIKLDKAV